MLGISVFARLLYTLLTTFSPKMYEFATGHWLFRPKDVDDIPQDVVHLAQMTQRTGQDHDDATLKQYEIQKKQPDLKGKERTYTLTSYGLFTSVICRHAETCNCGGR